MLLFPHRIFSLLLPEMCRAAGCVHEVCVGGEGGSGLMYLPGAVRADARGGRTARGGMFRRVTERMLPPWGPWAAKDGALDARPALWARQGSH
jgi:hypothetical protein